MWRGKNRARRVKRGAAGRTAPARRWRPQLESCERRELLALDFASAIGVGGVAFFTGQVAVDAAGNKYLSGGFEGQVNFDPQGGPAGVRDSGSSGGSNPTALASGFVA